MEVLCILEDYYGVEKSPDGSGIFLKVMSDGDDIADENWKSKLVILDIGGKVCKVDGNELKLAINNCMNTKYC